MLADRCVATQISQCTRSINYGNGRIPERGLDPKAVNAVVAPFVKSPGETKRAVPASSAVLGPASSHEPGQAEPK